MTRIDSIFTTCRDAGQAALMPYVTGGYPSLEVTREVLPAIEAAGASIVEIGIPFSDPIADGPVIAEAMYEAIESGTTPERVFDVVRDVRDAVTMGLVAMVSESIVTRFGSEQFISKAAAAGLDGLIIPDTDLASADLAVRLATDAGLSYTLLVSPTTTDRRLAEITSRCTGFIYLLARTGITGEREDAPEIAERVALIRQHTDLPIAAGFGISRPEHVAAVTASADAAIVGSALVRRMHDNATAIEAAASYVAELATGLRHA